MMLSLTILILLYVQAEKRVIQGETQSSNSKITGDMASLECDKPGLSKVCIHLILVCMIIHK